MSTTDDELKDIFSLRHEFLLVAMRGKTMAEKKRLIMEAQNPAIGLISDKQAEKLIHNLGLANA